MEQIVQFSSLQRQLDNEDESIFSPKESSLEDDNDDIDSTISNSNKSDKSSNRDGGITSMIDSVVTNITRDEEPPFVAMDKDVSKKIQQTCLYSKWDELGRSH